jgi:ribonuclease PH
LTRRAGRSVGNVSGKMKESKGTKRAEEGSVENKGTQNCEICTAKSAIVIRTTMDHKYGVLSVPLGVSGGY